MDSLEDWPRSCRASIDPSRVKSTRAYELKAARSQRERWKGSWLLTEASDSWTARDHPRGGQKLGVSCGARTESELARLQGLVDVDGKGAEGRPQLGLLPEDGLEEVRVAEEVEDLVAALARLVRQVGPDEGLDRGSAPLERLHQVRALVAELELVEGEDGHGCRAQGPTDLLDAARVAWAQLLVAVQQPDLLANNPFIALARISWRDGWRGGGTIISICL
jgi:hypothetical protein